MRPTGKILRVPDKTQRTMAALKTRGSLAPNSRLQRFTKPRTPEIRCQWNRNPERRSWNKWSVAPRRCRTIRVQRRFSRHQRTNRRSESRSPELIPIACTISPLNSADKMVNPSSTWAAAMEDLVVAASVAPEAVVALEAQVAATSATSNQINPTAHFWTGSNSALNAEPFSARSIAEPTSLGNKSLWHHSNG